MTLTKEFRLFITFFIIYVYFVHWIGWNENSRFDLTRAIAEEHRFEIDSYANNTGDRAFYNGHYYSDKAPGVSLFSVPVYWSYRLVYPLFGQTDSEVFILSSMILITIFTSCIPAALCVVLLYRLIGFFGINENSRTLVTVAYGLGTPFFHTAIVFFGHALSTFFVFLAFYLVVKMRHTQGNNYFYIGLLSGLAILIEYPTAILVFGISILLMFLKKPKLYLLFLLGIFLGLVPLFIYDFYIYDSIFPVGYAYVDASVWSTDQTWIDSNTDVVQSSFVYDNFLIMVMKELLFFFNLDNPSLVFRLLFLPYRGLFFYNPVLLFFPVGLVLMFRKYKLESTIILFCFLLFLIPNTNIWNWWGGAFYGSRHLTPVIPFLMIPVAYSTKVINRNVFSFFVFVSILLTFIGLQNPEKIITGEGLQMLPEYEIKQHSLDVLANPLSEHYVPLSIKNGPRSRIFENLLDDEILPIDIRDCAPSKNPKDCNLLRKESLKLFALPLIGTVRLMIHFLSLIPLIIVIAFIWRIELFDYLKSRRINFRYKLLLLFCILTTFSFFFMRIG